MTKDEAIELYESNFWEKLTDKENAILQLYGERLCMPPSVFHKAIEGALGRAVFTHEFGLNYDGLKRELLGLEEAPSPNDIFEMIPKEKNPILVEVGNVEEKRNNG